ncbi:tyrosine-protein phosphatase 99A [Diorhabda sublineata]|uniref:tyrosine-protein phosphatase 99A n=1 Tax=Diorhabda sublineata TaxID=1163346 RepID=UPI0024E0EFA7|nr:tyrosine-protein phosphatase 99A [Diorhabda sublineata]
MIGTILCWIYFLVPTLLAISQLDLLRRNFDSATIPTEQIIVKAYQNQSLQCPGANEHSLVNSLQWISLTQDKKILEYSRSSLTVYSEQHRISLAKDYGLTIHPVVAIDTGDYICLINGRPEPDGVIQLRVMDVPDPPGRPLIVSFTSRTVDLSWASPQNNHFSAINHYIIHSRVGEDGEWDDKDIKTPSNDTTYQVIGLHPYTVYSFRVMAVNSMGMSQPSKPSYYMVTLREVPAGHVTITNAKNESASSVYFSWLAPPPDTIFGEFLGYRISYKPRTLPEDNKEIYLRDPTVTNHLLTQLEPWTQYYVTVQVFNPEGLGPNTTVLIMTDEGVPDKPRNLTILDYTSNSIYLQWANPLKKNGVIEGYRVYYMNNNFTEVQPDKIPYNEPLIYYNLTRLKPMTEYTIFVKAFTQKHEGYSSDSQIAVTDISGPSPPKILNLSCQANETIYIQWERPSSFYYSIDYYYVYINLGNTLYDNITIPTTKDHLETTYTRKNVTPNADYKIQIQASTRSNRTHRLVMGKMSVPSHIYISRNCDKVVDYLSHTTNELGAGILAGVLCASLALLVAGLGFLIWRKCFRAPYYYLDNPQCSAAALDWNITPEPTADYTGPIPVSLFSRHVQELHADGDIGFSKEYESIQNEASNEINSSEHSQHPDNKPKNRYLNIIAYDHSRVHLLTMKGQKISTYINANYIDGFQMNRAYIGTQGPLPSTFDCFWRMVWEQRVTIIVMITNLVERGRRKCDMYWPKEGTETYGVIQVKLVKEDIMATYTVRTLSIRHLRVNVKNKKNSLAEKLVYQYHYTNWPDHGTPDHPLPVIHFVKKSSAANSQDSGPIVVHCSAGVGRTGTYIVLDAMLRQIRARGEVNIFGFLKHIRAQRNFLVQTEEQYIFIHDALVEAIECGETNICRETFPRYVSVLQNTNTDEKDELWKPLDVQFRLVTSFVCKDFHLVSANKPVNQPKNRCAVILPVESSRVHLTPKPGEDGSDYINASWLQGFHSLREFIITQHPFKHTVHDFWQMIWDHSAHLIVMISFIDNSEYEVFWPVGDEIIETDTYTCKQTNEVTTSTYYLREFLMKSVQDDYEIPVKMLHCLNWPHQVSSINEMYHLPNFILDMQKIQNGPIVVVDRFGGTEAATFCALTTLKKHLIYDNKVDVYMYAKLYHNKRPGIWISSDDYMRLHLCVQSLCNPPEPGITEVTPDLYAMANGTINNGSVSTDCIRIPPEEALLDTMDLLNDKRNY